jgi:hypothetical protein
MSFFYHIIVFQVSGVFNFRPEHTQIQAKSQNVQDIGTGILHCLFYILYEKEATGRWVVGVGYWAE